jgi:hypothetical protein
MKWIVTDKFERKIRLTYERWLHILEHPEMQNQENKIKDVLSDPEIVRKSRYDENVELYYKFYSETPVTEKY